MPAISHNSAHDPGPESARTRAEQVASDAALAVAPRAGARIHVGTASWTDPTITAPGVFYPPGTASAEDRLRYYASRFPLVEVDSTYYALPARRTSELWVRRTPDDFTFNVKAFALMTGQPTEVGRLPKDFRAALPKELVDRKRIYAKDLPVELNEEVWTIFMDAIEPLMSSGKLGAVLLQYPPWFIPNRSNIGAMIEAKDRLRGATGAVEFRNHLWFRDDSSTKRTLALLEEHEFPYVMVDEPQGMESSVPPITAVTSPRLAMLRLHGRRSERWEQQNVPAVERYRYLYDRETLEEWAPRVRAIAREVSEMHVLFNNCYSNYGTTNAAEFAELLTRIG
ncbi:MAG: DUF72 domain-containing protein [Gemmatimonadaceae bacterium]